MYKHEQASNETIRKIAGQPHARDSFLLADVSDMSDLVRKHVHGHIREHCLNMLSGRPTDLSRLAEKFVHQFEDDIFVGRGWNTRDNVVGSFPNVPALLAGVPCAMRERYRTSRNIAPLTLYVELTGSSGVYGEDFVRRGAAILALCRMLSNTRPVEIWTTTTYGATGKMNMVACKLETSPLDVSRGAAMLCDEHIREAGYYINVAECGGYGRGGCSGWAYGVPDLERTYAGEILAGILNPGSTMFYIPAAYMGDVLHDPAQWIRDMLAKYGAGSDHEALDD